MKLLWVISDCGELNVGEDEWRPATREYLESRRIAVEMASGPEAVWARLPVAEYDALLAEFPMACWAPGEWLQEVQRSAPALPVVIWDSKPSFREAVRVAQLGAYDYIGHPATPAELADLIEEAASHRRVLVSAVHNTEPWRNHLVGNSRPMRKIVDTIGLIAARRCTVLVSGETGTGKEMVARAIHMASDRRHLPMVAVNCGALPATLLEAELFGHVKGAFTGAIHHRIGRFEQANRSTIFLDEIGEMPLELQCKLLRVLQERELQRLGSAETIPLDVRVVAASNADLPECVRRGTFREDLFYRLNVVPIRVPSLNEHPEDIPLLVNHFIGKICRQERLPLKNIGRETLLRLSNYSWPGNIRQLENAVEMAIALSGDRELLLLSDFPLPSPAKPRGASFDAAIHLPEDGLDFEQTISRIEQSILDQALAKSGGNKKQAAELLRLKRTTFSAKLKSVAASA